jgi:hypothetical protein
VTGKDREDCEKLLTESFRQKSTHQTGSAAIDECAQTRAKNTVEGVDISDVKVTGDRATATAKPTSGPAEGEVLELSLVKQGGDWKIDDLDRPSQADPETAERTIITTVLNFGSSEGEKGCEYLSYKAIREMGGESACKSRFADYKSVNYLPEDAQVTGRTATLVVRNTNTDVNFRFTLSRELGEWKIDESERAD